MRDLSRWLTALTALWLLIAPATRAAPRPDEYLIRLKIDRAAEIDRVWTDYALKPISYLPRINVFVIRPIDPRRPIDLSALTADRRVAWIEPNGLVHATDVTPDDPWYGPQQRPYLELMGLPPAWQLTRGDARPIAFVDTGVDLDHPDLVNKVWRNPGEIAANGLDDDGNGYLDDVTGWNFVGDNAVPQDDSNHGSHVSGSAAAQTDNGLGMAGISWGATIMPIKSLGANATGTFSDTAAGIVYAADNGARIINLSLGGDYSAAIEAAVNYAQSRGCLLIASTGNDGANVVDYPAALPGVLAVGSSSLSDQRSTFSNYGPQIDVVAPGEDIFSANRLGGYAILDGTSMSTAHVSGLAALIWSKKPHFTADEVAQVITSTARDIGSPGWDSFTGWGRIDAARALGSVNEFYLTTLLRP